MSMTAEIIACLPTDDEIDFLSSSEDLGEEGASATMLVREPDGSIALRTVADGAMLRLAMTSGCFRRRRASRS